MDGLRFDAVHAIEDDSPQHFLYELAETVRQTMPADRHIHLILENERNNPHFLQQDKGRPTFFTAQWNDDFHHNCHVLMTGQTSGYYHGFAEHTLERLVRCLREGFDYQGEIMTNERPRGGKCSHLSPLAFINFLQNHDQIGNRALGERLITLTETEKLRFYTPLLLLSPYIPMLFMGEEWAETRPFLFFCDFEGELAKAVRKGRRKEFAAFPEFADPARRQQIPDPNALSTFTSSKLNWEEQDHSWLAFIHQLLATRHQHIVPLLKSPWLGNEQCWLADGVLQLRWKFESGCLTLLANFSGQPYDYLPHAATVLYGENTGTLLPLHTLWLKEPHL